MYSRIDLPNFSSRLISTYLQNLVSRYSSNLTTCMRPTTGNGLCNREVTGSILTHDAATFGSHTRASITKQYNLVLLGK